MPGLVILKEESLYAQLIISRLGVIQYLQDIISNLKDIVG